MMDDFDKICIKKLKKNSHEAFDRLYDAYSASLYAFVLMHTKSSDAARDVVQETFIKIWEIRHSISIEGSFKSFLFTVARHLIIDSFRKQINKVEFVNYIEFLEKEELADNSVDHNLLYDDFCRKLSAAKDLLSERQRQIFDLSREQGLTTNLIAQKLGIAEQSVKNQLSSALKKVREQLKKYNLLFSLFI